MISAILLAVSAGAAWIGPQVPTTITESTRIAKSDSVVPSRNDQAAVIVRGNGLTVDFGGSTLRGSLASTDPDKRAGIGLEVTGNGITIRNLKIAGYKIGLIARNASNLKIEDCDFSYNWKQRLLSTPQAENEADWMSFHQNEKREWMRYGAGIYLENCENALIKGNRITGGQCGLMMTRCDGATVYNNDFSFLSGIGIGLYRSSQNRIMHNRVDWCVRGYSHGVYNRGQDSAGILMYEQSNDNVIAYNSVTHGGDGFFLWAGQATMDTAKGGCNGNLLYGNDFSHSPTNGIEATFSQNTFAGNLVLECWHGLWGGYSYDTKIMGNVFGYNAEAIAIEHGQEIKITGNILFRDRLGLNIWAREKPPADWAYPKLRDTTSRDYTVIGNTFSHLNGPTKDYRSTGGVITLRNTADFSVRQNRYGAVGFIYDVTGPADRFDFGGFEMKLETVRRDREADGSIVTSRRKSQMTSPAQLMNLPKGGHAFLGGAAPDDLLPPASSDQLDRAPAEEYSARFRTNWDPLNLALGRLISIGELPAGHHLAALPASVIALAPKGLSDGQIPFLRSGQLRGRRYILVDEWGPYDFRRPLFVPREVLSAGTGRNRVKQRFEVLGPPGKWRILSKKGVYGPSASQGTVPGFVDLELLLESHETQVMLQYVGQATVNTRGTVTPAGKSVPFGWTKAHPG